MLNWAARYFPILRVLKQRLAETDSLLEIGSGPAGIGMFSRGPFVGCDINFLVRPKAPIFPVVVTATTLPFGDRTFDADREPHYWKIVVPQRRCTPVQCAR